MKSLRCFAITHRRRLREETLLAAKYTLRQPLIPSWFQEIDLISATDLLSLLTYHNKCGNAVYALRFDLSWMKSHYGSAHACSWLSGRNDHGNECGCPRPNVPKYTLYSGSPQWWEDFMEETFTALRDKPCKETLQVSASRTVYAVNTRNCQACSPRVREGMRDLVGFFARKIDETVSQVTSPFHQICIVDANGFS